MSVRLDVRLDTAQVGRALRGLAQLGQRPEAMLRAIGTGLVESTQSRFDTASDPFGGPWKPLLPAYAAIKRGPGILRESGMAGGLQASIASAVDGNEVSVGSNRIYAAVHQFGASIRPVRAKALRFRLAGGMVLSHGVKIPARPYLGISEEDAEMIFDVVEAFAARATGG